MKLLAHSGLDDGLNILIYLLFCGVIWVVPGGQTSLPNRFGNEKLYFLVAIPTTATTILTIPTSLFLA